MNKRQLHIFLILALTAVPLFACPCLAGNGADLNESELFSYKDYLNFEDIEDFSLSDDGKYLLWMDNGIKGGTNHYSLYLEYPEENRTEEVVEDPYSLLGQMPFSWSPSGDRFIYSSTEPPEGEEPGQFMLWMMYPDSGRKECLEDAPDDIFSYGYIWAGDDHLIFIKENESNADDESNGYITKMDALNPPMEIWLYDINNGSTRMIINTGGEIINGWVSPDGSHMVYEWSIDPDSWDVPPEYSHILLDTATGEIQHIFNSTYAITDLEWVPDGEGFYALEAVEGGMDYPNHYLDVVGYYNISENSSAQVPLGWENGLVTTLSNRMQTIHVIGNGFMAIMADGCSPKMSIYSGEGTDLTGTILEGEHQGNIFGFDSSQDGSVIAYLHSNANRSPQLYIAECNGESILNPRQVSDLNPSWEDKRIAESEIVTWRGGSGDLIEGVLRYPVNWSGGTEYPLIVAIHGGPIDTDFDEWKWSYSYPYQLFAQKGAFVFSPNYHGSANYGFEFASSVEDGHYYDLPLNDIAKGIDYLSERGLVDRERLGVTGWSNGGTLTLAIITADTSIRAASVGAAWGEWNAMYETRNGIGMNKVYIGANPYLEPWEYQELSPCYNAWRVETPLLMFMGTNDVQVPSASERITYRLFREQSNAPVEMYVFSGEGHTFASPESWEFKIEKELEWFDEYLFAEETPLNETESKESHRKDSNGILSMIPQIY